MARYAGLGAAVLAGLLGGDPSAVPAPPPAVEFSILDPDLGGLPETIRQEVRAARAVVAQAPGDAEAVGELGVLYLVNEFRLAAAACFARATALDPDQLRWWYYRGLSCERADQIAEAVEAYAQATAAGQYPPAYVKLADLLIEPDVARAQELYRRAAELDAGLPAAHYGLGRCAALQGRRCEAIEHLGRALELAPEFAAAHYQLALLLQAAGQTTRAAEHLRRFKKGREDLPLTGDPLQSELASRERKPKLLLKRSFSLWQDGKKDEAMALLEQAVAVDPQDTSARGALGELLLARGQPRLAGEQFRRILEIDPSSIRAKDSLARALEASGQDQEAERLLREALQQHPDHAPILHRLAVFLARRRQPDEALALLRRAARIQPGQSGIRHDLGSLLVRTGARREAVEQLQRAIELNPDNENGHFMLGVALSHLGDTDVAEQAWRRATAIRPGFVEARLRLAELALQRSDYQEGEAELREGLSHAPDAPGLASSLAWLLATCADPARRNGAEAVLLAEKACASTQYAHPGKLDTLAAAYAEVGRFEDAIAMQGKAIQLATQMGRRGVLGDYRRRLALYREQRPYREAR